jgi:signal transduction histidine kinase
MTNDENSTGDSGTVAGPHAVEPKPLQPSRTATGLLKAQDEAARTLLVCQSAVADLLRSQNVERATVLLEGQDEAATTLQASQSAVADMLRSQNVERATYLLEVQDEAATTLQASQSAVADMLRSQNVERATDLIEVQDEAATKLLAVHSEMADLLRSQNVQVAKITALNVSFEERVLERTEEFTRANTRLEAASHAKSEFLASMSHELRTPLNSIIGFSRILLDGMAGEVNEEQQRQLDMIQASGKRLLSLVNDILDLSKIEAGAISIEPYETNVNQICSDAVEQVRPQAEERGIELRFTPCTEECSHCGQEMVDQDKLMQIVLNLLSNAVKFTESGSVECRVECAGEKTMSIGVTDTGIGIDKDALERVFVEFEQIAVEDGVKLQGTGLGLSISRKLAYLLGGNLTVTSTPGSGSEFTLRLPLRFADDPHE